MNSLRNAGWKINGINQVVLGEPLEGIFVAVAPEDATSPPDGVLSVYNTLREAGVPAQSMRMNGIAMGKFGIIVGAHTKP
jgi:hypothetical protein